MLRRQYPSLEEAAAGMLERGTASSCFIEPVADPPGFKAHVFFYAMAPKSRDLWSPWASAAMDSIRWDPDWELDEYVHGEFDLVHCTKTFPATDPEQLADELDDVIMDRVMVPGCRVTTLGKLCRQAAIAVMREADWSTELRHEFDEFNEHTTHCSGCREKQLLVMLQIRLKAAVAIQEARRARTT